MICGLPAASPPACSLHQPTVSSNHSFKKEKKLSSFELIQFWSFLGETLVTFLWTHLSELTKLLWKSAWVEWKGKGWGANPSQNQAAPSSHPLLPPSPQMLKVSLSSVFDPFQSPPSLDLLLFQSNELKPLSIIGNRTRRVWGAASVSVPHSPLAPLARLALPCIRRQSQVPFYTSSSPPAHHREVGELW